MPEDEIINETEGGFEQGPNQPQTPSPLDKNQKIAAAGLAVFAILIIIMWFAQLRSNIYGPFNSPSGLNQLATESQNSDQALKTKDTDGDGLSDYDELNIYNTSPYLEDTDGDALKDSAEISGGTDPNCPTGRDCGGGLLDNTAAPEQGAGSTTSPEAGLNNLTGQNDALNSLLNQFGANQPTAPAADSMTSDQLNALKNIDAASLRELLIQAGMPKETLDKISDAELMQSYSETFSGQ